jgi:hypothetical protein
MVSLTRPHIALRVQCLSFFYTVSITFNNPAPARNVIVSPSCTSFNFVLAGTSSLFQQTRHHSQTFSCGWHLWGVKKVEIWGSKFWAALLLGKKSQREFCLKHHHTTPVLRLDCACAIKQLSYDAGTLKSTEGQNGRTFILSFIRRALW